MDQFLEGDNRFGDEFNSISLDFQQLCLIGQFKITLGADRCIVYNTNDVEIISVPDDNLRSGREAAVRALTRIVANSTGLRIRGPVSLLGRMLEFAGREGIDYAGYMSRVIRGQNVLEKVLVTKGETGDLSLTPEDVQDYTVYEMQAETSVTDIIDATNLVFASGKKAIVRAPRPNPRGLSRILCSVPAASHITIDDSEHVEFGRGSPYSKLVRGPECEETVSKIEAAMFSEIGEQSTAELLIRVGSALQCELHLKASRRSALHSLGTGARASLEPVVSNVAGLFREPVGEEVLMLRELAAKGNDALNSTIFKDQDQDYAFGSRQKTSGRSLVPSLALRVKKWREGIDLKRHALEDTARAVAYILTQDQDINQGGPGVKQPMVAALIVLARSSNLYHLQNGCRLAKDGKHYPL